MTLTVAGKQTRAWHGAVLVLFAVLLGGIFAIGTGTAPAAAHAELLGTTPEDGAVLEEAPRAAELLFNEPVRLIDGGIRLFLGDGSDPVILSARTVDTTVTVALPIDLAEGSYALSYRVVSADSHPIAGAISFQIGETVQASPPPDTALEGTPPATETAVSALTILQYLGLLILAGLVFFERIVLRERRPDDRGTRRIMAIAFGAAALASLFLVPASALRITGLPPSAMFDLSSWVPGILWQPVVSAALVTLAGSAGLILALKATSTPGRFAAVAGVGVAVAVPLLVGHTQTVAPTWLMITADLGHLLAGAFWTGAVIGLLRFLLTARPRIGQYDDSRVAPAAAADVVSRFSRYALFSVVLLAVSGTIMAILILDSWDALVSTGYGRTLLLKLGIVVAVVALAAWNRTRLLPAITRRPPATLQWATLRRILGYEAALLVTVIAVTGFLSNSSPAHEHHHTGDAAPPVTVQETPVRAESQGLTVSGTLSPTAPGVNILTFRLEYDGAPVTPEQVGVEVRLPEENLGPFTAEPEFDESAGEYTASVAMPVAGEWRMQVTARIDTYTEPIAIIPITIG